MRAEGARFERFKGFDGFERFEGFERFGGVKTRGSRLVAVPVVD